MDFNIDFNHVRSQRLLLIPQLKQAIEVLEMNSRELFYYVEKQLENNPALEEAAGAVMYESAAEEYALEAEIEGMDTEMPNESEAKITLKEHLLISLDGLCANRTEYMAGEYLIDNIDDNGYLMLDTNDAAAYFNVRAEIVENVIKKLQSLEPPGICARNLKECLLLQLRQLDEIDEEAILVVEEHLDKIAGNDIESVALSTGIAPERVRRIFDKVKSLEPKPGRQFYTNAFEAPVLPDIVIYESRDGFQALYNEKAFPDVCIAEGYMAGSFSTDKSETGDHMCDSLKSAIWLIKCLEQRENIITAISRKLCVLERDFFILGPKAIKLLDRDSFAAMLEMHETILEKAVNGKYLQCRWGVFELRSFFEGN